MLKDRAPFHRCLDLAEDQNPSASEPRHVLRGFGPLLFSDRRERQHLDFEFAAITGDQPLACVCLGVVRRIGDHDVSGRVREQGHPDQAVALMKYPGSVMFGAVRVGARLPKPGHTDWKSET